LKHSVHKVCAPNLHIAHFSESQDGANPTVHRICGSAFRQVQNLFDAEKITEQPSGPIMSRQAAEVGPPESEMPNRVITVHSSQGAGEHGNMGTMRLARQTMFGGLDETLS
jgi:hypothetical protein